MGRKEKLQKELDFMLEKLRFWRYAILAIMSGVIGVVFGISQGKITTGGIVITLLISAAIALVIAVIRISNITKEYQDTLELLEKEE